MTAGQDQLPIATKAPGIRTADVLGALLNHYRKPGDNRDGEILLAEPEAPGSTRRCDLLRIGMWASRGTGIDVHEIKVSRSDWLRELDSPAKAEAWWPYCNRFWVVAPPGIVARPELPEGWGLLELPSRGRRFKAIVPAATKEAKLTVPLVIELLRRADNQRLNEMSDMRSAHRHEMELVLQKAREKQAVAAIPYDVKRRLELLERLEKAIGVPLDTYGSHRLGTVTRMTPEEMAAVLADAGDHLAAQRIGADNERIRSALLDTARRYVRQLEQPC